jgi:MoaA/NifB/PqqE/SkfB family radical SAM enzyme
MERMNLLTWLDRQALKLAAAKNPIKSIIRSGLEKRMYNTIMEDNPFNLPRKLQEDKFMMARAILASTNKAFDRGIVSPAAKDKILTVLMEKGFLKQDQRHGRFLEKHSIFPPGFLVFCPTMKCNLACSGCYAGSSNKVRSTLPYDIIKRILKDKVELWGSHFTVISGGEPLAYSDGGKTLIDIFRDHPDQYFLFYTNGTLIDRETADQLGELGNATPAISVEGFEKETDTRREEGVYKKILKAFEHLRSAGVPFGISTTAFRDNAELIVSDEFVEFYFDKQGVVYQWIFQYMPIGRGALLEKMITPMQRMHMYDVTWRRIRKEKRFIADFWNCGSVSDGCIAAGGGGGNGYLYIDSNGTVAPCVFNPFTKHNVFEIFKSGGDLNDVYFSPFFEEIRKWQRDYLHNRPCGQHGNMIAPCPIRDHHAEMREIVEKMDAKPLDEFVARTLDDPEYYRGMCEYDEALNDASRETWDAQYLAPERRTTCKKTH